MPLLSRSFRKEQIVLGVDVGTTNIRCYAYNYNAEVIGKAQEKITVLSSDDGRHEIEPDVLWDAFQTVVKKCLMCSQLCAGDISCLGISTQRATFLTWNRETNEYFQNFITWKDRRAEKFCDQWNSSIYMKLLRFTARILYFLTRQTQFQIASVFRFTPAMVLTRLYWIIKHNSKVRYKICQTGAMFGTIDTWLIWKLTGGKVHATDGSNACVSGFFNPFSMQWATWILNMFHIPTDILPTVKKTCDFYGETLPEIFGAAIPIYSVVGDQQASLFGSGCFKKYDINCTMGTGSFLNMNTGSKPSVALHGVYPLVGWTISSETTYVIECGVHDVGTVLSLAQDLGFLKSPDESSHIAQSVQDSGGVYFFPSVCVLETSGNKGVNTSSLIGLQSKTSKQQVVRSILESLAFQVCFLFDIITENYGGRSAESFRVCGGVSKNDFILQLIADLIEKPVSRLKHNECSSLGAAFLAGLYCGVWESQDEISSIHTMKDTFTPNCESSNKYRKSYLEWKKAVLDTSV